MYETSGRFGVVVSTLVSINEVNLRRARLVLGWVTVSGVQLPVRENLSQYITSHPGQVSLANPSMGRRNEYQKKGEGDAQRLGNKGRYGS